MSLGRLAGTVHPRGSGVVVLLGVLAAAWVLGQPPRKPVLHRDEVDKPAEEVVEVRRRDPERARKEAEIGDFYMRRDNYAAAEARYREAAAWDPQWAEAHEKWAKALWEQGKWTEAVEVCKDFLARNPEARDRKGIEKLLAKYEKKIAENQER